MLPAARPFGTHFSFKAALARAGQCTHALLSTLPVSCRVILGVDMLRQYSQPLTGIHERAMLGNVKVQTVGEANIGRE